MDFLAVGTRIRTARKQKGMTQAELGAAVGLSTSFVGHVERGTRMPSVETLMRIAANLELSMDVLLRGEAQKMEMPASTAAKMRILNDLMFVLRAYADEWLSVE